MSVAQSYLLLFAGALLHNFFSVASKKYYYTSGEYENVRSEYDVCYFSKEVSETKQKYICNNTFIIKLFCCCTGIQGCQSSVDLN